MTPPLRRTRGDLIATAVIAAVSVILLIAAVLTAPVRASHLNPAGRELEKTGRLSAAPSSLSESFRLRDNSPGPRPIVADRLIITYADHTLTATTPEGETAWTYSRDSDLCSLAQAWGKVVADYRGPAGCGDVVALTALTGQYAGTRSAVAPEQVAGISSNDKIGYVSTSRVELWRSDLVRTVEYGAVEAPQEAGMQPNRCSLTSALTRTELLAITEKCGDGTFLRLQDATPEDSRKPEIHSSVALPEGAYLVAVGQGAAAVYDPATSRVTSYKKDGSELASTAVAQLSGGATVDGTLHVLPTADLPHHMMFYGGGHLLTFDPSTLAVTGTFDGARGTGAAVGDRLIFATDTGLAVANADNNATEQIIPVDRGGYRGEVYVDSAGAGVVEKRGSEVIYLKAN
ncbi:hypothetical protein [Corynebacterium sp. UBA2622]|uniref:Rv3212 family protein n=1 Tax=Corynebacterium sp. UBA2622 TaxID=1946393 RepID=UPI0025C1C39C|nr:hypothetical protein [Corynebacterium sp. UBA2622]